MGQIIRYNYPTTVLYGAGARRVLAENLKANGSSRPLIVTDRGLAQLPLVPGLVDMLAKEGLQASVFSGLWGNPVKTQVVAGVESYRSQDCDAIVGVGGGAAMDVAKAIALMVNHPGDLFDYEDGKPDARPVDQPIPYQVMIPTTAGTGSEVGRSAVVSDDVTKTKKIIFDPKLLPRVAILDPELTLKLPAQITATTGLDALCHLVEAYIAKGFHPMADGIALEGVRMIAANLVQCVGFAARESGETDAYAKAITAITDDSEAHHIDVRGKMLLASMMGAVAFQKGLGATHSCAHALSSVCDMHHGLANGILMPYVMRFNRSTVAERFTALAHAAGCANPSPEAFIDWLVSLQELTNVPKTLAAAGVSTEQVEALSDYAIQDGCHLSNPRDCVRDDLRGIFQAALGQ